MPFFLTPSVVIDNAQLCTGANPHFGTVLIQNGIIAGVASDEAGRAALRTQAPEIVDAAGHWLMPGLIDAHAHSYGTLLRGTENSLPLELWALHTTLYGRFYDGPTLRCAILLAAAERVRAGITGTLDHSPMLALAQDSLAAHEASGLRVAFAPFLHDVSDYDLLDMQLPAVLGALVGGPPKLDIVAFAEDFAALVQQARAGSGRVSVQLGPNAPQRCSPTAWALWRRLRDRHDVAVHTHLLETRAQAFLNRRWAGGLVAEMARQGMLEGRLTCAHGVWLSPAEMDVLARHDVTVSHNPASNLMLGSGVMDLEACTACGLRVALGSDSANTGGRADLFAMMRLAMMLPRRDSRNFTAWPEGETVFTAATEGGAAALGLKGRVGRIAEGQLADLVLVRSGAAANLAAHPTRGVLVQHAGPEHVSAVMVAGEWVLRDDRILAFDEAAVLHEAAERSQSLRDRVAGRLPVLMEALPGMAYRLIQVCG